MDIIRKIQKAMEQNGLAGEVSLFAPDLPFTVYAVEIHWGDWKHDHARLDAVIGKIGGRHISTMVTEENGSDTYSAIHYYVF